MVEEKAKLDAQLSFKQQELDGEIRLRLSENLKNIPVARALLVSFFFFFFLLSRARVRAFTQRYPLTRSKI